MDSWQESEHHHPQLGEIVGVCRGSNDIVQFRGIPFASIPARFRQSQLLKQLPNQPYIATKYGPECPQPSTPYPEYWSAPEDDADGSPTADELHCLNLTITAPVTALKSSTGIPVLIWFHGGALAGGSHIILVGGRRVYDPTDFIRKGVEAGKPVLVVGINYRTGPLGFLASSEIAAFSREHREPVGNYGLHDQRRAIEWVNSFIAGFGGDPQRVTLYGTSAGAASCHYHVLSDWDCSVQGVILSSGTALTIPPWNLERHQAMFDKYIAMLDLKTNRTDIVAQLSELPVGRLVADPTCSVFQGVYHPIIDGSFIPNVSTLRSSIAEKGNYLLMIGSCDYEKEVVEPKVSSLFQSPGRLSTMDYLRQALDSEGLISTPIDSWSPGIFQAYDITQSSDKESLFPRVLDLTSDAMFRCPPYYTALHSAAHCFLYEFQAVNSYPGATRSYRKAHHGINDLFVFNPAPDLVPAKDKDNWNLTAERVQEAWITFCYGELPWKPFDAASAGPLYVFADGGKSREVPNLEAAVGASAAKRWKSLVAQVDG